MLISTTYRTIQDCYQIILTFPSTGYASQQYNCPLEVEGEMKARGTWGGLRIYGSTNALRYCYLLQNNSPNDEGAKISYKIPSSWTTFKLIINNGTASLYINDAFVSSVNVDSTQTCQVMGGSTANPVDVRNVKFKAL